MSNAMRFALCVGLLASWCGAEEDLLEAQLAQARAIAPSPTKPGADEHLARLKAEIAAKEKVWAERLAQPVASDELLKGLPQDVLMLAHDAAGDAEKASAVLQKGVTLELLLALAAERNPDVRAAYQNWRASTRRFEQAAFLEDLVTQYRAFVRELDTKVGPQTHKEMPGLTFAFPSVLALKGEIVDAETGIAWLNYRLALRKALNEVARGFFELQYTGRASANLRETKGLFSQMAQSTQSQLEAGRGSQADALKAQSELAMIENRLETMDKDRANRGAQLNAMLALPTGTAWGAVAEADVSVATATPDEAVRQARAGNQKLLAARGDTQLMQLMVRMAETDVLPRASVGYSQFAPSVGADAGPTRSMMASFPERQELNADQAGFGANAAYIDELRVRVRQAREMEAAAEAEADAGVKDALFRADSAQRTLKTYGERVVPQSKQAFDANKAQYGNGNSPFVELLDGGRRYLENSLMLQESRRELQKALIDLEDVQGRGVAGRIVKVERKAEP